MADYTNPSQQRIVRIVNGLFGHEYTGCKKSDIAKALDIPMSTLTRDIANLKDNNWVEETKDGINKGNIRLTSHFAHMCNAMRENAELHESRLLEFKKEYFQ